MPRLRLLFVCTGNSARSQMAEGFARTYGREAVVGIAIVWLWNMLACGNSEYAAVPVAWNSAFQIPMYTVLGSFAMMVVP